MKKILKSKKVWIVLIIVLVIVGYFIIDDYQVKKKRKIIEDKNLTELGEAKLDLEEKYVKLVEASLNVYYTKYGRYPLSWEELVNELDKNNKESADYMKNVNEKLNKFEYKVRGDQQAVQIKYTDYNGNEQTLDFSYISDYH